MEVVIALCIVIIVLLIAVLVVFFVFRKNNQKEDLDLKEIGMINSKIDSLKETLAKDIQLNSATQINQLLTQSNKTSEENNAKLERFQKNISESILTRFDALNKQMNDKLLEINKKVDEKLSEGFKGTSETMAQVRERLLVIDEAQKNIEGLSKDVISLKNVLEGNQTRGQYGEYQLEMVLHNIFGDTIGCYETQYTLKKGRDGNDTRADAVVFMPEPNKLICIDSKFPFPAYRQYLESEEDEQKETLKRQFAADVKKHITAIKDKYIIEGKTAPQAMMFIPNDGVFAFIHHELQDIVDYAREKNVIIVSPSTIPAILFTINMVRIEAVRAKNVQEISRELGKLGKDFEKFSEEWERFSRQLATASNTREALDKRVGRITGKFEHISSSRPMIEENNDEQEA